MNANAGWEITPIHFAQPAVQKVIGKWARSFRAPYGAQAVDLPERVRGQ
jgi:hypothetical protein